MIYETPPTGHRSPIALSRLGARKAVLVGLSPAATFIAYNYNTPVDVAAFEAEAKRILAEVEVVETCDPCYHPASRNARLLHVAVARCQRLAWSIA